MDGHGVTNYAVDQPSYAFTGTTTEFDDALLQRGIVTIDQVLLAKGMSVADAERIIILRHQQERSDEAAQQRQAEGVIVTGATGGGEIRKNHGGDGCDDDDDSAAGEDDSDFDEDKDDIFLQEYRQKRLAELQEAAGVASPAAIRTFGEVVFIDRTEWIRHVNEDSADAWVVVCLTSSDSERTGRVEAAVRELAAGYSATKFVLIPSHSAIANWPESNLPSLFLYRHGSMQHELIRLPVDVTRGQLEETLTQLSVLG